MEPLSTDYFETSAPAMPEPPRSAPRDAARFTVSDPADLSRVRGFVSGVAHRVGLESRRASDLMLAAHELAMNSIIHGGGRGTLAVWRERDDLVCEMSDSGRFEATLAGRTRPDPTSGAGRGLWIVHQLCDAVHVHTSSAGSVVRVRMSRKPAL